MNLGLSIKGRPELLYLFLKTSFSNSDEVVEKNKTGLAAYAEQVIDCQVRMQTPFNSSNTKRS